MMGKGSPRAGSTPTMMSVGAFERPGGRGNRESPSSSAGTVTPTAAHFAASAASVRG